MRDFQATPVAASIFSLKNEPEGEGAKRPAAGPPLAFLADSLAELPIPSQADGTPPDWRALIAHDRNKEAIRGLLARLFEEQPQVAGQVDQAIGRLNHDPDQMDALLLRQHYRLSRWRTAARELVYRRFFDINTLVGLSVELERVFEDSHQLILNWLRDGEIDGVRVDHPDGMRDPEQYFRRLRQAAPEAWIVAEKILQPGERLPCVWKIAGTTGYDFLNLAGGLFVDPRGEAPLNEVYRDFTGQGIDFAAVSLEKKLLVLRDILGSDLNRLTALLLMICEDHREYRDYTRHELHDAIREAIARFSVYRTYVVPSEGTASETNKTVIRGPWMRRARDGLIWKAGCLIFSGPFYVWRYPGRSKTSSSCASSNWLLRLWPRASRTPPSTVITAWRR